MLGDMSEATPLQALELGFKPKHLVPVHCRHPFGHLCMTAKIRKQSVTQFHVSYECAQSGHSKFSPFCTCLKMTVEVLQVLIWRLQINFSEEMNSQIWYQQILKINCDIKANNGKCQKIKNK